MDWGYILCVDDNLMELNTLANQLQEEFSRSHIVYKAESGEEATLLMDMLQASQKRIELIVCDQTMPGIKGSEFLNNIHRVNPEIMKLLLLAPNDPLLSEYLLSRETIHNFLEKPWRRENLILTVESLLKLYKISRHIEELQEISLQFGPVFDLPVLLRKALRYIQEITTAWKVAIAITDGNSPNVTLHVSNAPSQDVDDQLTQGLEQLIRKVFAKRREPLMYSNAWENEFLQRFDIPDWYKANHVVCIPLWRQNNFFGVLYLADKKSGLPFFREDVLSVKIIAYQLLSSLENIRLTEEKLRMERVSTIGNMAGEIIHDLKGPMTTILGFAELLESEDCDTSEQQHFSKIIAEEVEHMVEMVEEILEFSRGDKMKLNLQPCGVEELVAEVCNVLRPDLREHGIDLISRRHCRKKIYADKSKLKRVFFNIANNAKEAIGGSGKFSINSYMHRDGEQVEFRLADSGPGIPEHVKRNIFEPFVTHGKKRGTGLGMSITKKIITDHGGDIWVESEEGMGTIFYFTIPVTS